MPRKLKNELSPLKLGDEKIGQRITRIRKSRGITQQQLADKIGITQTLISDYETGRVRLFDEMVIRVALALSVSTDTLLGIKKEKSQNHEHSLRIFKRINRIEKLSPTKQKSLFQIIDGFLNSEGV